MSKLITKNDLKAIFDETLPFKGYEYIVEPVTVSFSFSSQRYNTATKDVSKEGYTPIGIVGYNFESVDWLMSKCYINGNTATLLIFRTASASATSSVKLYVLYKSNE